MERLEREVRTDIKQAFKEYRGAPVPLALMVSEEHIESVKKYIRNHPDLGKSDFAAHGTVDVLVVDMGQASCLINKCYNGTPMRHVKDIIPYPVADLI